MNSDKGREERAREWLEKHPPSAVDVAAAAQVLMDGYQIFLFLSETFGALLKTDATLTLSADAAAGLSHVCEMMAEDMIDAYGRL